MIAPLRFSDIFRVLWWSWTFRKSCESCRAVYRHDTWFTLPVVGMQYVDTGRWLELRNCRCGSTIAVSQ